MKKISILILFLSMYYSLFAQNIYCKAITDILGNKYSVENSSFNKFSSSGVFLFSYENLFNSSISSVDISNPYKLLIFYKSFNRAIILDEKLAETETIKFDFPVNNICWNSDGNLLIYNFNAGTFEIYNTITKKTESIKSFNINYPPILFFVQNDKIYLATNNEIFIFDNYFFNIQKTIQIKYKSYQTIRGEMYLFDSLNNPIKLD